MPADEWLTPHLNQLKWAIVDKIASLHYTPEIFTNPMGTPSIAGPLPWSARDADQVMRKCIGAAILGFPRWQFQDTSGATVRLPTEYNHYEGALARTLGLPTLVLVQDDVLRRVVFDSSFGYFRTFNATDGIAWLSTPAFTVPFGYWKGFLDERRDVFLGYCSGSKAVAAQIKALLQANYVTVLDWQLDFTPANSILEQIQNAACRTSGAIFLFTKDDEFAGSGAGANAAPRDNVVFEAGYFAAVKGKSQVLIVLEDGAKMPADLGGDIYASFSDRADISPVIAPVQEFLAAL